MRANLLHVVVAMASMAAWACGSSVGGVITGSDGGGSSGSSSGSSSGGSSSGSGSSSGGSSGGGVDCPTTPCTGGQVCCFDATSKGVGCSSSCSAADRMECVVPSDCTAGTVCCQTAVSTGTVPNCTPQSTYAQCMPDAQCQTSISITSCAGPDTLRLCTQASDCTNDPNTKCCNLQNQWVCVGSPVNTILTCK